MTESLKEFWTECEDLVERLAVQLAAFEKASPTHEQIDSIYRDIHTIKGSAQLFSVQSVAHIAHTMETSLGPVRDSGAPLRPALVELLYCGVRVLDKMIRSGRDQDVDAERELKHDVPAFVELSIALVGGQMPTQKDVPDGDVSAAMTSAEKSAAPTLSPPAPTKSAPSPATEPSSGGESASADGSGTIRVPVGLLDRLMTLMGEMVLVRNQVLQYSSRSDDLGFLNLSQRLDVVTSDLQSEMMKTRMQPIGNILTKFQRLVRDLAKELGKKIEIELSGAETELDKTLLEAVKDPLTHIIRNACDHGMETPAERRQNGKGEVGKISVKSYHEGGQVIIEVRDDGRGLHREVLVNKAVEKGLITRERAASMSDREVNGIIFMPGFSTAAKVTNISGRGVGMDVVRSNIDKIGGMVEIQSKANEGTAICLKIPLTLAIVPAMIIRCDQDRYAIPQVKLVELLRVESAVSETKIEFLQGRAVLRLRGQLLPLLHLKDFLGFTGKSVTDEHGIPAVANIVIVRAESQMFGLIVDEILDTADIVVKPLSRFLKSLNVYSGATVLGDGSVALILDVLGIAHRMNLTSVSNAEAAKAAEVIDSRVKSELAQEFLLFRLEAPAKHAIPLDLVHRLEEFRRADLECSGGQRVMRYRDMILPIYSMNDYLGYPGPSTEPSEVIPVIVTQRSNRYFGIEVNEILDVLTTEAEVDEGLADRPGLLGSLIANKEVVVVVESLRMLEGSDKSEKSDAPRVLTEPKSVLYAEDNAFFRRHVTSVLSKAGYRVEAVNSGLEAMQKLEASDSGAFDIILSDIEMPRMNGLQLAEQVRKNGKWKDIPIVALTTKFDQRAKQTGLDAGFDAYLEKLNPEELVASLHTIHPRGTSLKSSGKAS